MNGYAYGNHASTTPESNYQAPSLSMISLKHHLPAVSPDLLSTFSTASTVGLPSVTVTSADGYEYRYSASDAGGYGRYEAYRAVCDSGSGIESDAYGVHSTVCTSAGYINDDRDTDSPKAERPSPSVSPSISHVDASHSSIRQWANEHVWPWARSQRQAASTIRSHRQRRHSSNNLARHHAHHAEQDTSAYVAAPASPHPPTLTSKHFLPSSYLWRSYRWSYLRSFPPTNWNELYQNLFESVPANSWERRIKARQMKQLMEAFADFARQTAELMMEEVHLPAAEVDESATTPTTATTPSSPSPSSTLSHLHSKFFNPMRSVGGLAGGEKYILNNILFKFARDWSGLFGSKLALASTHVASGTEAGPHSDSGSDSAGVDAIIEIDVDGDRCVQKSAANEIRHMNALIREDGTLLSSVAVGVSLSVLVRLRGCAIMCTALAPISGERTLVYGSSDGGAHIASDLSSSHKLDPRVDHVISELSSRWNLAAHPVADHSGQIHQMRLATDVELHASQSDGRLYLVDLARFLPPTSPGPMPDTMEHLYHVFRPEFMRSKALATSVNGTALSTENHTNTDTDTDENNTNLTSASPIATSPADAAGFPPYAPLSPDAFSGFGRLNHDRYASTIHANMRHMKYALMPRAAGKLIAWWKEYKYVATTHTNSSMQEEGESGHQSGRSNRSVSVSEQISDILHEEGINIRYLALVRSYISASDLTHPSTSPHPSLSLSMLLLYELVARACKQIYFGWVRHMMHIVGRTHQNELQHMQQLQQEQHQYQQKQDGSANEYSLADAELTSWTDIDLERWMRHCVVNQLDDDPTSHCQDHESEADTPVAATIHHESSLLFAYMLYLLFGGWDDDGPPTPSPSSTLPPSSRHSHNPSSDFFRSVLWPSVSLKFGAAISTPDRYSNEGRQWLREAVPDSIEALKLNDETHSRNDDEHERWLHPLLKAMPTPPASSLINESDKSLFEQQCAQLFSSSTSERCGPNGPNTKQPAIEFFLQMLLDGVGLDFLLVQQSMQRVLSLRVDTPLQLVAHVIAAVSLSSSTEPFSPPTSPTSTISNSASSLAPNSAAFLYLLAFHPKIDRVELLPFWRSLEECEMNLLQTLRSRERSLHATMNGSIGDGRKYACDHPALLSTLEALLHLYQVHSDEDKRKHVTMDSNPNSNSCFERGETVVRRLERIYDRLLDNLDHGATRNSTDAPGVDSSTFSPASASLSLFDKINFAKLGWFYLHFGRLHDAHRYFIKEHAVRLRQIRFAQQEVHDATMPTSAANPSSQSSLTGTSSPTASKPPLPPLCSALRHLSRSLECLGIISRELGRPVEALTFFKQALSTIARLYDNQPQDDNGDDERLWKVEGINENENEQAVAAQFAANQLNQPSGVEAPDPLTEPLPGLSQLSASSSCDPDNLPPLELSALYTNLGNAYGVVGCIALKRLYLLRALRLIRLRQAMQALAQTRVQNKAHTNDGHATSTTRTSAPISTASLQLEPTPALITICTNLASCYIHAQATFGEVLRARSILEQCITWCRQIHGTTQNNVAQPRSQHVESVAVAAAAAATFSRVPRTDPPSCSCPSSEQYMDDPVSLAPIVTTLASVYGKLASMPDANLSHDERSSFARKKLELLQRALDLARKQHGPTTPHPDVAIILTSLGMAVATTVPSATNDINAGQNASESSSTTRQQVAVESGLRLLQQALTMQTQVFGGSMHNDVATTLSNMGVLHGMRGDVQMEIRSLSQAMHIFLQLLPKHASLVAATQIVTHTSTSAMIFPTPTVGVSTSTSQSNSNSTSPTAALLSSHPSLLFTQQRLFRARQRLASMEREALARGVCSFTVTGTVRTNNSTWFKCHTCCPDSSDSSKLLGACASCVKSCHVGHEVEQQDPAPFYCDCGEGVFPTPCQALHSQFFSRLR